MSRTPPDNTEAVGAYDNTKKSSSPLGWILGLLALLLLLLLVLWLLGVFGGGDDVDTVDRDTDNTAVIDGEADERVDPIVVEPTEGDVERDPNLIDE